MTHTTPTTSARPAPLDRGYAEAAICRVAVCAFTYYPDKPTTEPGYTVAEDVEWCLAPLSALDNETLAALRQRVALLIVDTAQDRRSFVTDLYALAGEPSA